MEGIRNKLFKHDFPFLDKQHSCVAPDDLKSIIKSTESHAAEWHRKPDRAMNCSIAIIQHNYKEGLKTEHGLYTQAFISMKELLCVSDETQCSCVDYCNQQRYPIFHSG